MKYCNHYWGYGQRLINNEWVKERFCWISDCHLNEVLMNGEWVETEPLPALKYISENQIFVSRL